MLADEYRQVMETRRSIYEIADKSPVSDKKIEEIIAASLLATPSSFNSQSAKTVLLLGDASDKLWDIVLETLKKITPAEKFGATEKKIASFKAGYGTILYFDDTEVVDNLIKAFPTYAETFPVWSMQAMGMLQLNIWQLLEANGLGASLQHYNPLIDEAVRKEWNIPESWKLCAEMPFGEIVSIPEAKNKKPVSERLLIFK
jgi:predicted oxidoreductase (fatty acid repression mutant protein)